ncbi:MAG: transcriptional regulator TbsP [Halobacteriaceae archaeon]
MASNLLGTDIRSVLEAALDTAEDRFTLLNPPTTVIEEVVEVGEARGDGPSIRLVAPRGRIREVMDDFLVASTTADLLDGDRLRLRTAEELPQTTLLVGTDRVIAIAALGETVAGIATTDSAYVADARAAADRIWDDAEQFNLRTPPMSRVRATLSDDVGANVEGDFEAMLASMETARGDGEGLDEVTVSLLAAAKNEELLYDISRWGEDAGVASKATFSRTKTQLEEAGLITTEKVPIDVGRPRLRLQLADDRLRDASPDELASVAQSVLAA